MHTEEFNSSVNEDSRTKEEVRQRDEKSQLDSKFSILMVFVGLMVHFVIFGTIGSFGIYLAEYSKSEFKDQPRSVLSLIGTVGPAIYAVCAVPSGILVSKLGHRGNIFSGAIILGVGLVIASFSQQIWTLFIGQAVLLGVAVSLCFVPTVSIVPQWLNKYRGIGVGVCAAGSGVGGLVLAPLLQAIIDSLGWRWALRINGIIGTVILSICGILLKARVPFKPPKNLIDWEIIKDPRFIAMWGMGACSCFAYWVPFFLMPLYCQYYGISAGTASLIVGLTNGAAAIGRIATGKLSDKIGNINTLIISNIICSLTFVVIWYFATVTWSLIVFAVIFGIFSGAFFTNSALLAPQLFGLEKLAQVNGLYYTCCAPGFLAGTVTATAIVNAYTVGNYTNYLPLMFFLFGCYMSSVFCLILLRVQVTRVLVIKV
ncbi:MFS general substrate transporter [Conidiobolus coronatus NRRL 28638]|uniref:MFS general substrate transporter n=1 Tax=Conidiobolus coronatus (strain ATCC 28846 / CBS 209.66 / NRRL 28638) TaxID=796925 RepID=A0A137NQB5_CONC2|nr:MFS general substrate transporter [Conidiobolus coronatus NRRL 28638]|eukprot:KXN64955.1 MFS general substrate transporter [Conidiobolus coronatus NRRL 28638]